MRVQFTPSPAFLTALSVTAGKVASAWSDEEVDLAFHEAGWDGPLQSPQAGVYLAGPMSSSAAHRVHKAFSDNPGVQVEVEEPMTHTAEDRATVKVTIKGSLTAATPDPHPVRRGVQRFRDRPVDHQETGEKGPDPKLMTQTPGVGTITFDTTMGETMVSGAQTFETGQEVVFLNGEGHEETGTIESSEDDGYVINEKFVNKQRVLRVAANLKANAIAVLKKYGL